MNSGTGARPLLVVLRARLLHLTVDLDHRGVHIGAASNEVEVAHAQTGQLAPAQPGIREHQHEEAAALPRRLCVDRGSQLGNLL